tara:strand:+ start:773 stop:1444 length:672 start_codon:yes stop_codon:yes gene_type:complete
VDVVFTVQLIFIFGFVITFFLDNNITLSLRVIGKKLDAFPEGTLRSTQILLLNRVGAAFFFTSAGFLVDVGLGPREFLILFSISWFLLSILSFLYVKKWVVVSNFLAVYLFKERKAFKKRVISFSFSYLPINFPFFFFLVGVSVPVILAAFFPDFRGTLLQLGFLFNGLASMLLVFVIEPKFINHISNNDHDLADELHQKLIFSKALILMMMSFINIIISLIY